MFKPGDRVRRTEEDWRGAIVGKIYTISGYVHDEVTLKEITGELFNESRFELIEQESTMAKTTYVYNVLIVDKTKNEVVVDDVAVSTDQSSALASVVVKHAKEVAGKDIFTSVRDIASFTKE